MASGATPGAVTPRSKWLIVIIPAAGVAILIISVAIIVSVIGPASAGGGRPMSDGSDGSVDDPDLLAIGTDGLKYRDLKKGNGMEVTPGANVTVHYTGWLPDGTVFDSSKDRGQPAQFSLTGVVQGWSEGIPGMKIGGIRKLVIPAKLGYGERGSPPKIPPNSTLIFEVEVLDFRPGGMPGGLPPGHP